MTKDEMRAEIRRLALKAEKKTFFEVMAEQLKDYSCLAVYGAGNMGLRFVSEVRLHLPDIKIDCFLDRNANEKPEYLGFPVYKPDDTRLNMDFREKATVVLALFLIDSEYNELTAELRKLGYKRFLDTIYVQYLRFLPCPPPSKHIELVDRSLSAREIENILKAFDLMADEHSQEVFFNIFCYNFAFEYKIPSSRQIMEAYVGVDVPFRNKYRSFVDCGAYTGDTLEQLVKRHKVNHYFGFEPDRQNYAKLACKANAMGEKIGQVLLMPLGLGNTNEFLRFDSRGDMSSRLDKDGSEIVQVVRLDDVLKGYHDLTIKMDIEGAETKALEGAKRIITETKPDLAICVYHKISDFWRIPLILNELAPEYIFYLRSHNTGTSVGMLGAMVDGVVLYATTVRLSSARQAERIKEGNLK